MSRKSLISSILRGCNTKQKESTVETRFSGNGRAHQPLSGLRRPSHRRPCPRLSPRNPGKAPGRGRTHHGDEVRRARPEPAGKQASASMGRGNRQLTRFPSPHPRNAGPIPLHPPPPAPLIQARGPQTSPGRGLLRITPHSPCRAPETLTVSSQKRGERKRTRLPLPVS